MAKTPSITINNLRQFSTGMDDALIEVKNGGEKVIKKIAFDVFRDLQEITPHKTGRARAGWIPTIDAPPSERVPAPGKSVYPKTPFTGRERIKYDSVVNLSNNVEYIIPLDRGHSKQASSGIIAPAMARLQTVANKLLALESKRKLKK